MTGSLSNIHADLMKILTDLEAYMEFELHVDSGYRDPQHNQDVGGVPDSEHKDDPAQGADVFCRRSPTRFKIVCWLLARGVRRIGIGNTFIHIGISQDLPQDVMWTYYPDAEA